MKVAAKPDDKIGIYHITRLFGGQFNLLAWGIL